MIRSCVVCRMRCHPADLFRFQLNTDSQLALIRTRTKGRSAWLCKQIACVRKLESNPKLAQKALRKRPQQSIDLMVQIRTDIEYRICKTLRSAQRSGNLRLHTSIQPIPKQTRCIIGIDSNRVFDTQNESIPYFIVPPNVIPKETLPTGQDWYFTYKSMSKSDLLLRYLQEQVQMG